jgi:hypothetical protein
MPQPAPDWISFDADKTEGLDLLGLRAPVQAIGKAAGLFKDRVSQIETKCRITGVQNPVRLVANR